MKNNLSVAFAVYNEEHNIEKALKSVQGLATEIIVVDGSSTDGTVSLAEKYKAKVYETSNKKMFHLNKQLALDKCTGDWILQLDADEVVSPELKEEISKTISRQLNNDPIQTNGYWIPRKNFFLGNFLHKGGNYPDYTLRLYRRGSAHFPCQSVHEQVTINGQTGYFAQPLIHFPYPNFAHYLEHFNLYTDIFAQELNEKRLKLNSLSFITFMLLKPKLWFLATYIRHKGFLDGFPGFVFALFSALRFPVAYIKYWEISRRHDIREKSS